MKLLKKPLFWAIIIPIILIFIDLITETPAGGGQSGWASSVETVPFPTVMCSVWLAGVIGYWAGKSD